MAASSALSENVWPGYVAATASLLLSLLLTVAILAITTGQVGFIQDEYVKATRRLGYFSLDQLLGVARSLGVNVDAAIRDGRSTPLPAEGPQAHAADATQAGSSGGAASRSPIEELKLLDFARHTHDRQAARLAAERLSRADAELLKSVDLSRVDLCRIRFSAEAHRLELASNITPRMLAQVDFSLVDFARLDPNWQEQVKPFLARQALELLIERKNLRQQAAPQEASPRPPEPARALPGKVGQGEAELLLDFVDRVQLPDEKTLEEVRERMRQMRRSGRALQIGVHDPSEPDTAQVRSAYLHGLRLRSLALQAGWPADAVKLQYARSGIRSAHQEGFQIHLTTVAVAHE